MREEVPGVERKGSSMFLPHSSIISLCQRVKIVHCINSCHLAEKLAAMAQREASEGADATHPETL